MQVKRLGQGEIICKETEIFVRDRENFEIRKENYGVFGGNVQEAREEVRDKETFEIEGSQDRENPLYICYVVRNIRTGTFFKQKGPSYQKKELLVNLTSNAFQRKHENAD